jgi:hypothetical protein
MNGGRPPFPVSVPPPREARDSLLDSVIDELDWHDAGATGEEKQPLFSPHGVHLFFGSVIVVLLIALASALA